MRVGDRILRAPAPARVVWDGQSLNLYPAAPLNVPTRTMAQFPDVPWANIAIDGQGFGQLAGSAAARRDPQARTTGVDALVLNGGQGDVLEIPGNVWGSQTGAVAYARMSAYATSARAAGFDVIVACTLPAFGPDIWPLTGVPTPAGFQARTDLNDLIEADPNGAFDAVALCHLAPLDDATNGDVFAFDRLHLDDAEPMADAIAPVLAPFLAA